MDHWPLRVLIALPIGIIFAQYAVYALPSPVFLKVIMTLLAKHTTGMVLIMVSLRFIAQQVNGKDLVLGHCPRSSLFRNHSFTTSPQPSVLKEVVYQVMSFFFSRGCEGSSFLLSFALKCPREGSRPFGGKVD